MIQSEKDLENYMCEKQENFVKTLKCIYGEKNINFLGRQVHIGKNNIADLIYYFDEEINVTEEIEYIKRTYVVVELKYRKLIAKDLAQLSRYIKILYDKLNNDEKYYKYETDVVGVFVSFGFDEEMKQIIAGNILTNDISFVEVETNFKFDVCNWNYKDDYIEKVELDNRLEKLYKEK